ncbi:MAG: cell division protein FtsL [Parcubacteria group bacterium]|nr:cell division protein FtsL [Parcubacteria group bacterium]
MIAYIESKKFHKINHNRGLAVLILLIVFSIFSLVFLYSFQSSSIVACSYEIREQKEKFKNLQIENENLEMGITQLRSPANLEEIAQSLNMVEVEQVIYLGAEKTVAVKQ